jgi:hypothetical protein
MGALTLSVRRDGGGLIELAPDANPAPHWVSVTTTLLGRREGLPCACGVAVLSIPVRPSNTGL